MVGQMANDDEDKHDEKVPNREAAIEIYWRMFFERFDHIPDTSVAELVP